MSSDIESSLTMIVHPSVAGGTSIIVSPYLLFECRLYGSQLLYILVHFSEQLNPLTAECTMHASLEPLL